MAYEKAVHQQRMRTEISQAKRETDYFKANVEKSKRENVDRMDDNTGLPLPVAKKSRRNVTPIQDNPIGRRIYEFRQKETDDAIRKRKLSELTQKKMANEKLEQGQEFNTNFKNSSPPEKKHKNGKSTKEHEKTKKALNLPFASPRNASRIMANSNLKAEGESRSSYSNTNSRNATVKKGDTPKLPHSPAKTCSSKNSKSKLIETATSNSLLGGKSCTTGPPAVSTKTNKSKTRSGVGTKRMESDGGNDRTEFLKSVLL